MSAAEDERRCCLTCACWRFDKPLPARPDTLPRGLCRLNPVAVEKDSKDWCSRWQPRPAPAPAPEAA